MANTDRKVGFQPKNIKDAETRKYKILAAETTQSGDVLEMDSTGYVKAYAGGPIVGVQNGAITSNASATKGENIATAATGDTVSLWDDPFELFVGQIAEFTLTDPYTTRATAACYDNAGSAGAQYINNAVSTNDTWKIHRLNSEQNGTESAVGAYAKVECSFNPGKHLYGPG